MIGFLLAVPRAVIALVLALAALRSPAATVAASGRGDGVARPERGSGATSGAAAVRALTGARTRVVWVEEASDAGHDRYAIGDALELVGLDSDDGRGERRILAAAGSYVKPLLTAAGTEVVFSSRLTCRVYAVGFDGGGLRELHPGIAADVWRDPVTGFEWVYAQAPEEGPANGMRRFRLDAPEVEEPVWEGDLVDVDNFQVSGDGRLAAGVFPWPRAALADLASGAKRPLGRGCWPSLAPDDSGLAWVFDGTHRGLWVMPARSGARRPAAEARWVDLAGFHPSPPGDAYHPRWSNHVRFLVLSGPYPNQAPAERERTDGVEIYLGRFDPGYRRVEAWAQVTKNRRGDYYPDAWIEGGASARVDLAAFAVAAKAAGPVPAPSKLHLVARPVERTATPDPARIRPYRDALVVNAYAVVRCLAGGCPEKIAVAEWGIRDGKALPAPEADPREMLLLRFDDLPELSGERILDDLSDPTLPLYVMAGTEKSR